MYIGFLYCIWWFLYILRGLNRFVFKFDSFIKVILYKLVFYIGFMVLVIWGLLFVLKEGNCNREGDLERGMFFVGIIRK